MYVIYIIHFSSCLITMIHIPSWENYSSSSSFNFFSHLHLKDPANELFYKMLYILQMICIMTHSSNSHKEAWEESKTTWDYFTRTSYSIHVWIFLCSTHVAILNEHNECISTECIPLWYTGNFWNKWHFLYVMCIILTIYAGVFIECESQKMNWN